MSEREDDRCLMCGEERHRYGLPKDKDGHDYDAVACVNMLRPALEETRAHVEALEGALREVADPKTETSVGILRSIARAALAGEPDKGGAWTHGYSDEPDNRTTYRLGEPTPMPVLPLGESEPPTGTAHAPGTCCTALDCPSCVPTGTEP